MSVMKPITAAVFLVSMLVIGHMGFANEKPPEVDNHGLHLVHHSDLRLVYTLPGTDFSAYDMAMQQNRVTNKAAEDRIVKKWAETMAKHMNAAIGK